MQLAADRIYYQTNAFNLRFDGGSLNVTLRDGNFAYDAICPLNGNPVFYPPSEIPPCQLGATGFVASGDLDGDGVRDDNEYWSIVQNGVVPAARVEPSRPELCELYSGPPSPLPRPLSNFEDETVVVFYNIRTPAVTQYDLTMYSLDRPYGPGTGELERMDDEVISGQYVFTFPRLNMPELNPVAYAVTIAPMLNALNVSDRSQAGFRFTSGSWFEGKYQMDPRLITPIKWTGNDRTIVRRGDRILFSILDPTENSIAFPPTVPENPVLLTNPTVQQYNMPPFFFVVGDEGVMNLQYNRFLPTSGVAFDSSGRDFRAQVLFVDTFNGYVQTTFPAGTSKRDRSLGGDVDKDGMTNGDEFSFQQITNENINAAAKAQFVPFSIDPDSQDGFRPPELGNWFDTPFGFTISEEYDTLVSLNVEPIRDPNVKPDGPVGPFLDAENHIVIEVPIRPNTGNTLKYQFQEYVPGKKGKLRGQKLKLDENWEDVVTVTESITEQHMVRVECLSILDTIDYFEGPMPVTYDVSKLVLRSAAPVVDPLAPLPNLTVQATPTALK